MMHFPRLHRTCHCPIPITTRHDPVVAWACHYHHCISWPSGTFLQPSNQKPISMIRFLKNEYFELINAQVEHKEHGKISLKSINQPWACLSILLILSHTGLLTAGLKGSPSVLQHATKAFASYLTHDTASELKRKHVEHCFQLSSLMRLTSTVANLLELFWTGTTTRYRPKIQLCWASQRLELRLAFKPICFIGMMRLCFSLLLLPYSPEECHFLPKKDMKHHSGHQSLLLRYNFSA